MFIVWWYNRPHIREVTVANFYLILIKYGVHRDIYIYITVLEGSTDIQNSCNNKVNQTVLVQIFNYNFLIIL